MGQNEPIVQVVEYTNALEPQRGQSSIHEFLERPRRQEDPSNGKPSLQKQTEGTSCAAGQPECENRHVSGRQ